jgi:hypothetical protein
MNSAPVFAKSFATFKEAYPTVKAAQVKVTERKMPGQATQTFTEQTMPPSVSCSNLCCKGGGVMLDSLISRMVLAGQTDLKESTPCFGMEIFTRNKTRGCLHSFSVQVHLEYLP